LNNRSRNDQLFSALKSPNEDILLIIQSIQNGNGEKFLEQHFTKVEQSIIKKQLPDLTSEDKKTKNGLNY